MLRVRFSPPCEHAHAYRSLLLARSQSEAKMKSKVKRSPAPRGDAQTSSPTRHEHDLLGSREVPAGAYYGIQTLRAVENFPITGVKLSGFAHLIDALALIKKACASANRKLGVLDGAARPRHRRGLRRDTRREAARPVRGGHDPGGRGNLHQHERQRGHRQPGPGTSRAREGRIRPPPSQRSREPVPVHERRLSHGHQDRRDPHAHEIPWPPWAR